MRGSLTSRSGANSIIKVFHHAWSSLRNILYIGYRVRPLVCYSRAPSLHRFAVGSYVRLDHYATHYLSFDTGNFSDCLLSYLLIKQVYVIKGSNLYLKIIFNSNNKILHVVYSVWAFFTVASWIATVDRNWYGPFLVVFSSPMFLREIWKNFEKILKKEENRPKNLGSLFFLSFLVANGQRLCFLS